MQLKAYKLAGAAILCAATLVPRVEASSDDPQFKVEAKGKGFFVTYSWPGEGKEPVECTVIVRVKYSKNGDKDGATEDFKLTRKIGASGDGWSYFDGKAGLDTIPPLNISIQSHSCS